MAVQPVGAWLQADDAPTTTMGLWRLIRQRVQQAAMEGFDWRAIIDGLRLVTQQLCERMADGQLQFIAGRVISNLADAQGLHLQIRRRGQIHTERITVDQLIQCTGVPRSDTADSQPFLNNLRKRSLLQPDPLQLGLHCSQSGQLLTENGVGIPGLYTLGSPRKGQLWGSIAVPELRHQARDLAQVLLNGHDNICCEPQKPPATDRESVDMLIGMFI